VKAPQDTLSDTPEVLMLIFANPQQLVNMLLSTTEAICRVVRILPVPDEEAQGLERLALTFELTRQSSVLDEVQKHLQVVLLNILGQVVNLKTITDSLGLHEDITLSTVEHP
jgi:hypothetical protein